MRAVGALFLQEALWRTRREKHSPKVKPEGCCEANKETCSKSKPYTSSDGEKTPQRLHTDRLISRSKVIWDILDPTLAKTGGLIFAA